jgi:hypothetical protein
MSFVGNNKIQSYTCKDKLVEYTSKIAKINFIYFMFIFIVASILFVSFLFISFPRYWLAVEIYRPIFYGGFYTTLRTLGIILAILTIPGLTCIVFRFIYFFQLRSALEELSNTYPVVKQSTKRAADFLIIGVFGEIISFFVIPFLGNIIGGIMVMYSFYTMDQVLRELKIHGLYSGEENKLLFRSYLGFVVILPITGVLTFILVATLGYGISELGTTLLATVFASIFMMILITSTILHLKGFKKLSHSFTELYDPPQDKTQFTPTTAVYAPPQKFTKEGFLAKQPIPTAEEQAEFKYCSSCGHKIEQHSKFCSNCGAVQ